MDNDGLLSSFRTAELHTDEYSLAISHACSTYIGRRFALPPALTGPMVVHLIFEVASAGVLGIETNKIKRVSS
jgi:hypothetical protein